MKSFDVIVPPAEVIASRSDDKFNSDIVKAIAMDIGKDVAAYIEIQYPEAVTAASSTFLLSLRNCVYNEIMASLEITEEGAIRERLEDRRKFRRHWKAMWKKLREKRKLPKIA